MDRPVPTRELTIALPWGLGDIVCARGQLDTIAPQYRQIRVGLADKVAHLRSPEHRELAATFAALVFQGAPYAFDRGVTAPAVTFQELAQRYAAVPVHPRLLTLCAGHELDFGRPYIVLHTKSRALDRILYDAVKEDFFASLRQLGKRYALVLLGERRLAEEPDYQRLGEQFVYCNYPELVRELPVLDYTYTGATSTAGRLRQLQQDCLTMLGAKASVHMGLGGAFCFAAAVCPRVLCARDDTPFWYADRAFPSGHPTVLLTRKWGEFRRALRGL